MQTRSECILFGQWRPPVTVQQTPGSYETSLSVGKLWPQHHTTYLHDQPCSVIHSYRDASVIPSGLPNKLCQLIIDLS